jgi:hypothetical protein
MARLSDQRQELYAFNRARGMLPAKAAVAAGYAVGSGIYTKLENDPEMLNRITELANEVRDKREQLRAAAIESAKVVGQTVGISKAWVIAQLAENAVLARQEGDMAASNAALKLIGDEYGMFKGNSGLEENDNSGVRHIDLDATEALLSQAREAMGQKEESQPSFDIEGAMALIAGNRPRDRVAIESRQITTGSETDQSFMAETDVENGE